MPDPSIALNQREFSHQAKTFADPRYNQVLSTDSDWVFAHVPRRPHHVLLDVAAGTGLGARALAGEVRQCIALDATPEMLATGAEESHAAGVDNIVFMRGDAADLPFLADSFDTVLCRFALHHFATPDRVLAGIHRVLKPGGWFGLADLVVSEQAAPAALQNQIETLRDPSHAGALSASALQDRAVRAGFEVVSAETREVRRPLLPWMEQTETAALDASEITALLDAEVDGGASTGLAPKREPSGALSIAQTLTSLLILKPHVA